MEYVFELSVNYHNVLKENLEIAFFVRLIDYIVDVVVLVSYIWKQTKILQNENDQNSDENVVVLINVAF